MFRAALRNVNNTVVVRKLMSRSIGEVSALVAMAVAVGLALPAAAADFSGSSSGTFTSSHSNHSTPVFGVGSSHVTWGLPKTVTYPESFAHPGWTKTLPGPSLTFGPAGFSGTEFPIGSIHYFNGTYQSGVDQNDLVYFTLKVPLSVNTNGNTYRSATSFTLRTFNTSGAIHAYPDGRVQIDGPDTLHISTNHTNFKVAPGLFMKVHPAFSDLTLAELSGGAVPIQAELYHADPHFKKYWQFDADLGGKPVNPSKPAVGSNGFHDNGCTVTSLAMIASYEESLRGTDGDVSPVEMSDYLSNTKQFAGNNKSTSVNIAKFHYKLKDGETIYAGRSLTSPSRKTSAASLIGQELSEGNPLMLALPSPGHSAQETVDGNHHYVMAYGLKPGVNPDGPITSSDILIADPGYGGSFYGSNFIYKANHDEITLNQYFSAVRSKTKVNYNFDKWFNKGEFKQNGKTYQMSNTWYNQLVTTFGTEKSPSVSIHSPVDVVLTDKASGIRYFSSKKLSHRYLPDNPNYNLFKDPFFDYQGWVAKNGTPDDPSQLTLNDPEIAKFYDFDARNNYFAPKTDVILSKTMFDKIEAASQDISEIFNPYADYTLYLPDYLKGAELDLEIYPLAAGDYHILYHPNFDGIISPEVLSGNFTDLEAENPYLSRRFGEFDLSSANMSTVPTPSAVVVGLALLSALAMRRRRRRTA